MHALGGNLTFSENIGSAIVEIEVSSTTHHRSGKVYKKKEQKIPETQEPTPRYSDLVDNSNDEEISEVNVYNTGTKYETLDTKITKCVLCDGKELLSSYYHYTCINVIILH